MQAILKRFPGAEIVDVRDYEAPVPRPAEKTRRTMKNLGAMMKQVQEMQTRMQDMQAKLEMQP